MKQSMTVGVSVGCLLTYYVCQCIFTYYVRYSLLQYFSFKIKQSVAINEPIVFQLHMILDRRKKSYFSA